MSKGWHGEKQAHSLASKGIRTSKKCYALGEELQKEYVKMSRDIYSKNKVKIKKLYKERGLEFDKKEYHSNNKFIWENETERIELIPEENVVTIYWQSKEKTELLDELKEKTKELGGIWKTKKDDKKKDEEARIQEIKSFDGKYFAKFIENEREARHKGFSHCPILKPMIKEYLEKREEKYEKSEKTLDEIVKYVYGHIDKKYSYPKNKEDDWEDGW